MTIYQVDAFTREPFAGNPAAVCVLSRFPSRERMQQIASEMNLSETAFVVPDGPDGRHQLRWFTPAVEVRLCGHATLAAAHVVWETGRIGSGQRITFETLSGELSTDRTQDGLIRMDFPAEPPEAADPPAGLLEALGVERPRFVGNNRMDALVEILDEEAVRSLRPNLSALENVRVRGVIVTARSEGDADFVSRFFAPAAGVPEDPVTGSAHCCLGPYWAKQLGRTKLRGYQASKRGGYVDVEVAAARVVLSGHAVTVMKIETLFD